MGIVVDGVVLLLVTLFTFLGYKKGLVKVLIKILAFFIAVALALVLYKPVAEYVINETTIDDTMQESIASKLLPEADGDGQVEANGVIKEFMATTATTAVNDVAEAITVKVIQIACLIALYIVIRLVLILLSLLSGIIEKIPGLKQINELGGAIYGFLKGVLIILVILMIVSLTSPIIPANLMDAIQKSFITAFVYNNNILLNIIL